MRGSNLHAIRLRVDRLAASMGRADKVSDLSDTELDARFRQLLAKVSPCLGAAPRFLVTKGQR